ncbi:MAG TPA: hypothetical protein VNI02_16090 [Blastocatellia bacterium]|jgi:hypothetical protein|nr:hypothetical protein [Blastocatellia bacterium]
MDAGNERSDQIRVFYFKRFSPEYRNRKHVAASGPAASKAAVEP